LYDARQKCIHHHLSILVDRCLKTFLLSSCESADIPPEPLNRPLKSRLVPAQYHGSVLGQDFEISVHNGFAKLENRHPREFRILLDELERTVQELLDFGISGKAHKIGRDLNGLAGQSSPSYFEVHKLNLCIEHSDFLGQIEFHRRVCIEVINRSLH